MELSKELFVIYQKYKREGQGDVPQSLQQLNILFLVNLLATLQTTNYDRHTYSKFLRAPCPAHPHHYYYMHVTNA